MSDPLTTIPSSTLRELIALAERVPGRVLTDDESDAALDVIERAEWASDVGAQGSPTNRAAILTIDDVNRMEMRVMSVGCTDKDFRALMNSHEELRRDRDSLRARIVEGTCIDPESLPTSWAEWDALDGEEKGATLEDYFLITSRLANTPSGSPSDATLRASVTHPDRVRVSDTKPTNPIPVSRVIEWRIYEAKCDCGWSGDECPTEDEAKRQRQQHVEEAHHA